MPLPPPQLLLWCHKDDEDCLPLMALPTACRIGNLRMRAVGCGVQGRELFPAAYLYPRLKVAYLGVSVRPRLPPQTHERSGTREAAGRPQAQRPLVTAWRGPSLSSLCGVI